MPFKLRLFLLVISAVMLWGGGQGVLTAVTQRQPTTTTCADFAAAHSPARWLELKDCEVLLGEAGHIYTGTDSLSDPSQIYIPVHVPGDSSGEKPHVFLATRDPGLLAIYNGFAGLKTEDEAAAYVATHAARLAEVRTVRGLVRYGIDLDEEEQRLLAADAAANFVILDEGKEPRLFSSLLLALAGLATAVFALGVHRLFVRRAPAPPPPAEPRAA